MAGGTTDKSNNKIEGQNNPTTGETRPTTTTGGADASNWPEEYKDILDAYFNAIEGHK